MPVLLAGMLVADLKADQQATLRQILGGMLRERFGGGPPR